MKKYLWIFLILGAIIGFAIFAFNNNEQGEDYIAQRTGINNNGTKEGIISLTNEIVSLGKSNIEEQISEFSTRLPNDTQARDSNIELACNSFNGTVIKSGETFSFWNVLGATTKEKGYKKAKTFTSDGETIQSYGGGVCQVSTTIYNAVLEVEGLKVIERHEHSKDVPYIKDGKDAAVAYNTSDLKFKNTLEYDIRIDAKVENRRVKISLVRICVFNREYNCRE